MLNQEPDAMEIPACRGESVSETTTAIEIRDLNSGKMLPTVQRRRITITEWQSYKTTTHIFHGVFIPSQVAITAVTALLVLGCSLAFCILTALKIHFVVVIATVVFMCYVLYMLSLTAFTEPGFLPRNKRNPVMLVIDKAKNYANENRLKVNVAFKEKIHWRDRKSEAKIINCSFTSSRWGVVFNSSEQFQVSEVTPSSPAEKQGVREEYTLVSIQVGEKKFPLTPLQDRGLRYCWTCKIARPERSKHCSSCNACCQKFDHHCPWTGTCIGLRNYTYFVRFVSSLFALIAWVLVWTLSNMSGMLGTGAESPGLLFFGAFLAACVICVGGLGCYHFHLIWQDRTTAESRRGVYRREGFDTQERDERNKKCSDKCAKLCLSPLPPSSIISLR